MKVVEYDHRGADTAIPEAELRSVRQVIQGVSVRLESQGQSKCRTTILNELARLGWSQRVRVSGDANITVAAMKGRTAACVQFGNVCRAYADLMKLQALYDMGVCDGAIFVLLSTPAAKALSANLAHSDRLIKELKVFRSIINVPIRILAVE